MSKIRIVLLWHMHQPFYKDLVTGEYRLPWVRLHALKDYYGMVKLLDEFPGVRQNFNLVPSLMQQIQDYVDGTANDPFLRLASKPSSELSGAEKRFALQYLFQANLSHHIARYPRFLELYERLRSFGFDTGRAQSSFSNSDITDLQVLSQLAWFDEYFLEEPDIAELVHKGRDFTLADQSYVVSRERELIARVLPAYADAARRGSIEVSTSPYYHPILPLLCDSNMGGVSTPGLALPRERFMHPEDAEEQLRRGLDLHQQMFGVRPTGCWPSEGSVSEQVLAIGHGLGLRWMATDEGVLARTLNAPIQRHDGALTRDSADRLYRLWRYEREGASMHMVFRDHSLSDLIGFTYSGLPAQQAAQHFVDTIKRSAWPVVESGRTPVVPIILDGENAWEYYPGSGREFLRRLYEIFQSDPQLEPLTISQAIERTPEHEVGKLTHLVPGSWINANFNVWIGAPEDNRSWDSLAAAHEAYDQHAPTVSEAKRKLAYEELLIAEGSDWNWWYGPEHHSANDADFDELYRRHLSNVYHALGARAPEALVQPIAAPAVEPVIVPQTGYIHPKIEGDTVGYFDWVGAACYALERRGSAMHGQVFALSAAHAGIDADFFYARLDFTAGAFESKGLGNHFEIAAVLEVRKDLNSPVRRTVKLDAGITRAREGGVAEVSSLHLSAVPAGEPLDETGLRVRMGRVFEMKVPLQVLGAELGELITLRFTAWRDRLPIDALPVEGAMEVPVLTPDELAANL